MVYPNSGRSTYDRDRGPWELLAYKEFETRGEAIKEELRLKQLKNRDRIREEFGLRFS